MQRDEEREDERNDEQNAAEPERTLPPEEVADVSLSDDVGGAGADVDQPATREASPVPPAADIAGTDDLTAEGENEPVANLPMESPTSQVDAPADQSGSTTHIELAPDVPLPTAPAPARRIPHHFELPLERGGRDEDPVDEIFPPELRRPLDPHDPGAGHEEPDSPAATESEEIGQPLPSIQVLVVLADARAHMEEAADVAAERMAPEFEEIAEQKVKYAFWVKKCEERAADWRLRGP